ncbi:6-carboxytetrahydropterin synthase QueD [bacterium]|nr:6-carboxytetrahydropterin synthase QueD [bacterium]
MFEIKITSGFSSAHRLEDYNGECENLHGHNWKVALYIAREKLDASGMVMDFKKLNDILENFLSRIDHQYLNGLEFFKGINPTAEHIAMVIYNNICPAVKKENLCLRKVQVWETQGNSASYCPE